MDVGNAERKHGKALNAYLTKMRELAALDSATGVTGKMINDTRISLRETWKRLTSAHHDLTEAYLERLGW